MTIEFYATLVCHQCNSQLYFDYDRNTDSYRIAPCDCTLEEIRQLEHELESATALLDDCRPLCPELFI